MVARELKLVTPREPERPAPGPNRRVVVVGLVILVAAGVATWLGADAARVDVEAREMAESTLQRALELGNEDREVREALVELRRAVGRRPLDARTRVIYASLLLGLSGTVEDIRLAAFHAARAAELSPVTVSVIRSAALVLAHTGETQAALDLVRRMFGYDPARAARLLSDIESRVLGVELDAGIPREPEAWMAWAKQLRLDGRTEDEQRWLERTHALWPDHLPVLEQLAARAYYRSDEAALAALFPPAQELPDDPRAAPVLAWRARWRAERQQRDDALADVARAKRLDGRSDRVCALAGDVYASLGDVEQARHEWNRALHLLPREREDDRRALLSRLARLEDRHGKPADALRLWQALLELDPQHVEARRRIDDLTGFTR